MKLNSGECEALMSSGVQHHLSPLSLARSKSDLEDMAGDSMYSPTRKSSKPGYLSRVHCIPILMFFVFFVLWAASSEVKPDVRMATTTELDKAIVHLKVTNHKVALPGSRRVLFHDDESSQWKHGDRSLQNNFAQRNIELPQNSYFRGNAR